MVEACQVLLCGLVANGAACKVGIKLGWLGRGERMKWDVPKSVGLISRPSDDDLAVFEDFEVVLSEEGDAIIVAEFSNGDEGACLEVVKDVSCLCIGGK